MGTKKLFCVIGKFIHPHKDSTGEYLDNLTYDEAMAICNEWRKDKIHKNIQIVGSRVDVESRGDYGKVSSRT